MLQSCVFGRVVFKMAGEVGYEASFAVRMESREEKVCDFVRSDGGSDIFPGGFRKRFAEKFFLGVLETMCYLLGHSVEITGSYVVRRMRRRTCCLRQVTQVSWRLQHLFHVRSADRDQFKARNHWAPPYLLDEVITNFFQSMGRCMQ